MFKDLMKIWRQQTFSARIVDEFMYMLDSSEEMLSYAFMALTKKGKLKGIEENIYQKDRSINIKERDIRQQILVHLSANPGCNLAACLVLISISKDAERLGDYVKNLFQLKELLVDSKVDRHLFQQLFDENGDRLLKLFKLVQDAFRGSDREIASQAIRIGHEVSKSCEETIESIIVSDDYTNRQAVVIALGARYMKRIALHLANIASSIVNPLPEVDYRLLS